ncbi:MAG: hypothetical protein NWT08_10640 [Akkermansiaceae bacterium]|nr:hypothetical protein [Akkermansiaceae bacterium]MDP4647279.1 hypothetical protein [Akkermansiaceae bacterium]MDP4722495.1 hypothetical protein [Akkermansiaceae bacterium]MDP4781059.1 hypothetical protein [Akkermansiaceae bacterium]MDP4848507.1 hypothetical protein [Akkermansiaceae bacterium]
MKKWAVIVGGVLLLIAALFFLLRKQHSTDEVIGFLEQLSTPERPLTPRELGYVTAPQSGGIRRLLDKIPWLEKGEILGVLYEYRTTPTTSVAFYFDDQTPIEFEVQQSPHAEEFRDLISERFPEIRVTIQDRIKLFVP